MHQCLITPEGTVGSTVITSKKSLISQMNILLNPIELSCKENFTPRKERCASIIVKVRYIDDFNMISVQIIGIK